MRNFRKAALAGATAVAVAFGSTAVATAASSVKDDTNKSVTTITLEEAQANVDKTNAEQEQAEKTLEAAKKANDTAQQQAKDAKTATEILNDAAEKSEAEAQKAGATQAVKDKAAADRKAADDAKAQQTNAETLRDAAAEDLKNAQADLKKKQDAYQDAKKVLADILKTQEIERIEKDNKGIDVYKDGVNSKDSDYAMGYDVFGKNKNHDQTPTWAVSLYGATWFLVASAIAGLVVGPLYNFIVHGPVKF